MSKKSSSSSTIQGKVQAKPRQSLAQKLLEAPEQIITLNQPLPPSDYSKRSATLNVGRGRITREVILRKRNEMVGIFYVCIALLIFSGLVIEKEGQVKLLVEKFAALNGVGPVFLALFAIFCGMKRLMGYEVFKRNSQILAFPVMYFSLIGFLAAVFPQVDGSISLGGVVGNYFFWLFQSFLGKISAGIVMGAIFLISFMHVTEVYVSDILASFYRFSKSCFQKLLRWSLFLCVVLKEAVWFCIRKIHQFLYVLIHDSILLLEKGIRPFGIQIFQSEPRVFMESREDSEIKDVAGKQTDQAEKDLEEESEISLLFGRNVEIKPETEAARATFANQPQAKSSAPAPSHELRKEKPRAITVQVEREEPSKTSANHLRMQDIVEEREISIKRKADPLKPHVKEKTQITSDDFKNCGEETVVSDRTSCLDEAYLELENIPSPHEAQPIEADLKSDQPIKGLIESNARPRSSELKELLSEKSLDQPIENEKPALEEVELQDELAKIKVDSPYPEKLPEIDFLQHPPDDNAGDSEDELYERGHGLILALENYKIEAELQNFVQGPTITRFELSPAPGTKLNRIKGLTNEIAMALASKSVRIEAPIPGTSKVGVEIPNENPVPVYFREVIGEIKQKESSHPLTVAFGMGIDGQPVIGNLAKMPHLLVAGATGAGKSVCVNTLISSILFNAGPDAVKFVMIDPKQVELAVYRGIPHLITDVVTNPEEAAAALRWGVDEMEQRYTLLSKFGVRHIDNFNEKLANGELNANEPGVIIPDEPLPYVVIIVDELADLMMIARKDVETSICRIAQKARAVGIHLVIATQRPSVDVITGLIKANLPSRIAFMVNSGTDSRTILNQVGAESLLGRGDMLYFPAGQNKPDRVQGAFMTDDEVAILVEQVKANYGEANYQDIISSYMENEEEVIEDTDFHDDKLEAALEVALREKYVSTSMLQRHLGIGYNRAARIVDVMYARGICGSQESGKKRKILVPADEAWELMNG